VYLEQLTTAVYLSKPADRVYYRDVLNRLAAEAEPPAAATARLARMLTAGTFFDGLELVEPGVVTCSRWRPDVLEIDDITDVTHFSGVVRKP
jgi:hypothetical protein